ncbi:hypothetical protein [Lysobacter gummosus]|uniref:hypothetical protein n=1 Tax=Lysobacter gummosus TaxID=262324 RepID=UPI003639676E
MRRSRLTALDAQVRRCAHSGGDTFIHAWRSPRALVGHNGGTITWIDATFWACPDSASPGS